MKKNLPVIVVGVVILLVAIVGFLIWQKSQVKPVTPTTTASSQSQIKQVDLASQPQWVQDLIVTAKKGKSANSLDNVTISVSNIPAGIVSTVDYVIQYQTTNKGTQGALSTNPVAVNGATTFTRTIDLGTCSTSSCVRHEGVTSVDVELDFTTTSGDKFTWTKTLDLS